MVPFAYKNFRKKGADALADASFSPQRLVLIHTAAALGLSLILNILHYVLQQGIAGTGGLSGIGTRTVLEFIQTVLQIVNLVVLPFWNIGYLYTTLLLSRRQNRRRSPRLSPQPSRRQNPRPIRALFPRR